VALEADFLDLCETTVTHQALSAEMSLYGNPTFSTASTTYYAHLEFGDHLVVTPSGKEEVASAILFVMSSSASFGLQDKVTLADGTYPELLRVDILTDDEGQHHLQVHI